MSLFKSREWWAVNLNENEMYDSQCLLTSKMGKDETESIFLGNHDGFLRLFSPSSEVVDGGVSGYKASHLSLELQLSSPILQINEGTLVSGSHDKCLAVLHPRLFSVYALKKKESKNKNVGDEMDIEIAYQHVLRHSAHSFVLGPFGGVRGRCFTCIQALDGLLSFYEQESFAFQIYLPNFLLPFTFAYLEKTDSFLFLNGFLTFDCYSYEALASAVNSNDKKIMKMWEFNLGEGILDLQTVTRDGLNIIVLSERNLFGLNENGKMTLMKRLEYKPVAFCCYVTEEKRLMIIIATDGNFLNLYEETNLKWSMKIDLTPVALNRIFLENLPGGVVLLSEDGYLQVVYIGTHPSVYLVPPLVQPEIDYQKASIELRQLQKKIADNDFADPITADLVSVDLRIDKSEKVEDGIKKCNFIVEIDTQCSISKIQVLLVVEPPLAVTNPSTMIGNCCEKTFVESSAYLSRNGFVSDLELQVTVTYLVNEGVARSIQKKGKLPLGLVVEETAPAKESQYKITITTNKPICGMTQLFKEFSAEETSPNAIGFKFLNSEYVVTILAAKSSQRYRLQSDDPAAIFLLLSALVERLKLHFRKDSDFNLTYSTSLPLDVLFEKIQLHHNLIKKGKLLEEKLSKETCQYRTVQKKILTNLKDVTPKPASNLHKILKDTSQLILSNIEELEQTEEQLFLSRCSISSLNRILLTLLELMTVGEKDLKLLRVVFNPNMHDTEKQGWLEVQEAAAAFLLRTTLAKSTKDQQKPTEILLEPMSDTSKLVKHLTSVIDRVTKGTHLLERTEFENKKEPLNTIQSAYESEESLFDEAIPVGSKYVGLETAKREERMETVYESNEINVREEKQEKKEKRKEEKVDTRFDVKEDDDKGFDEKEKFDKGFDVKEEEKPREKSPKPIVEREKTEDFDEDDDDAIWDVKIEEMRI